MYYRNYCKLEIPNFHKIVFFLVQRCKILFSSEHSNTFGIVSLLWEWLLWLVYMRKDILLLFATMCGYYVKEKISLLFYLHNIFQSCAIAFHFQYYANAYYYWLELHLLFLSAFLLSLMCLDHFSISTNVIFKPSCSWKTVFSVFMNNLISEFCIWEKSSLSCMGLSISATQQISEDRFF